MANEFVKYYVVDAFADSPFKGNPAAVCLLEEDRDEKWLQDLASEFNISQTCYLTRLTESDSPDSLPNGTSNPDRFSLRWFTPVAEVKLCGHATLASAHVLFSKDLVSSNIIEFSTLSGILTAKKIQSDGEKGSCLIELNFPTVPTIDFNSTDVTMIYKALNVSSFVEVKRTSTADDLFVVLPSWESVTELQPNFDEILKCPGRGIIVSAAAPQESGFDFCSRFFCPKYGINEDPVCGSAHCALAPYWSQKMGKHDFVAFQASPRSGTLRIHVDKDKERVLLRGKSVTVMEGSILV